MQYVNLTDDELWREIAENTNAMSLLFQEHSELDAAIDADPNRREDLLELNSHFETANKLLREYHDCTAELRRRYPLDTH